MQGGSLDLRRIYRVCTVMNDDSLIDSTRALHCQSLECRTDGTPSESRHEVADFHIAKFPLLYVPGSLPTAPLCI